MSKQNIHHRHINYDDRNARDRTLVVDRNITDDLDRRAAIDDTDDRHAGIQLRIVFSFDDLFALDDHELVRNLEVIIVQNDRKSKYRLLLSLDLFSSYNKSIKSLETR